MVLAAELLSKSFGGGEVAAAPNAAPSSLPVVSFPPGATEARNLLLEDLRSPQGHLTWIFLVGGPGNGKSELTRQLAAEPVLKADFDPSDEAHQRSYDYQHESGARLRIINDATIRTDGRSLVGDLHDALSEGVSIIANVNRGILVEDRPSDPSADGLPEFLLGGILDLKFGDDGKKFDLRPDQPELRSHVSQLELTDPVSGTVVHTTIVRLDVCSLFEPQPATVLSEGKLQSESYRVTRLDQRNQVTSPAIELIGQVVERFEHPDVADRRFDPVCANLGTLKAVGMVSHVATLLRSAEIASGRLFTFREVWGAISLMILGPTSETSGGLLHLQQLADHAKDLRTSNGSIGEQLSVMQRLADYRFSQVLFGESRSATSGEAGSGALWITPVTERLRLVDPAIDATPGELVDHDRGWASPVLNALEAAVFGDRPMSSLRTTDPKFGAAVTDFDLELEKVVYEFCDHPDTRDADYDAALSWFGRYALRLYALAHGVPAFYRELLEWTRAWNDASSLQGLGDELSAQVKNLLVPIYESKGEPTLALEVFTSHTKPVRRPPEYPTLVRRIPLGKLSMGARVAGDRIRVKLVFDSRDIVELDLDFPLLREALAGRGGHPGVTELGARTSPRLERARAALIADHASGTQWGVTSSSSVDTFQVKAKNAS